MGDRSLGGSAVLQHERHEHDEGNRGVCTRDE